MTGRTLVATLSGAGLSAEGATRKMKLFEQASAALLTREAGSRGGDPAAVFVPGRLEVFGKHTDYAGGRSLICATDRGIVAASVPRFDGRLVVVDAASGTSVEIGLAPDAAGDGPPWTAYAEAVARRVARNFPGAARGAAIAFASDLPAAAGLSSSSALVVALFLSLSRVSEIRLSPAFTAVVRTPEELAGYLATVENGLSFGPLIGDRGVGTFGGSEDHTAMLCCRAGWLSQYSFCPVRREIAVPLQADLVFAIAASGVVAEKTGAARDAYNRAALMARRVLDRWNRSSGREDASLADACAAAPGAADRIRAAIAGGGDDADFTAADLLGRFEQFSAESFSIVPAASEAFATGDLAALAALAARSHGLAERWLGNQVPETSHLARSAVPLGAVAASAFGAGFGGSVWALVHRDRAERFLDDWRRDYVGRFPSRCAGCDFFETRPGPAAMGA